MSRRIRLVLISLGLIIIVFAIVALTYSFWPIGVVEEKVLISPTMFAPP